MSFSRPFAVFDVDGTISRHDLTGAISREVQRQRLIPGIDCGEIDTARKTWLRAKTERTYRSYLDLSLGALYDNLPQIKVADYRQLALGVLDEIGDEVYHYTTNLIRDLQQQGYMILALSGSEDWIVAEFGSRLGLFDDSLGSVYQQSGGRFTGQIDKMAHHKGTSLKQLVNKHNLDWTGSIAVGDTEVDIQALELVEQPICFNPALGLKQTASEKSWPIVIERKGLIYELEPDSHAYRLKPDSQTTPEASSS